MKLFSWSLRLLTLCLDFSTYCPLWTLRNMRGENEQHLTHPTLLIVSTNQAMAAQKKVKQMILKGNHLSFKNDLSSALGVISLLADKVPNHYSGLRVKKSVK